MPVSCNFSVGDPVFLVLPSFSWWEDVWCYLKIHVNQEGVCDRFGALTLQICLGRYSKPTRTCSFVTCSRWPCFGRSVRLDDLQKSLPISTIQWFCPLGDNWHGKLTESMAGHSWLQLLDLSWEFVICLQPLWDVKPAKLGWGSAGIFWKAFVVAVVAVCFWFLIWFFFLWDLEAC